MSPLEKWNAMADDVSIVDRIKCDDKAALDDLFRSLYAPLCAFATQRLGSLAVAEELVSDVFFTLWDKRHVIEIQTSIKAYLYACVRNECVSFQRRKQLRTSPMEPDTVMLAAPDSPEEEIFFNETNGRVVSAIDKLPVQCRQVFLMSRYDGLKYKEIAEILSISEKTVENQIVKALSILRSHLFPTSQHTSPSHNTK
jgi:RNA polymerase sigma-70 factor, ECF subfamily